MRRQTSAALTALARGGGGWSRWSEWSTGRRQGARHLVADAGAKAPLLDRHGRLHDYLRISLTERCNLRCQYCMPAEGVALSPREALLATEEVVRLARVFAAVGVRKVRLTGGEPTLRKDLPRVVESLKGIDGIRSVSMTTNGLVLTRLLPALHRAGLDALNISLDSLRPERYERMARRPGRGLARVLAGVDLALQLGYAPVKINCVLMKGFNDDETNEFVELTRDRNVEVRFIEFMPFSGNEWQQDVMVPYRKALGAVAGVQPELRPAPQRPNDTAKLWQVPGWAGTVGFITSMTEHFCGTCNRLRLTADGNLKVCLFGAAEVSLRDALRDGASDASLEALVRGALANKKARHAVGVVGARDREWRPRLQARAYCNDARLSHLDESGRARMVDVTGKRATERVALAACTVRVSAHVLRLLRAAGLPKGDALTVAQVAGVMGAKRAADLLPLCHPLPLDCVRVHIHVPEAVEEAGAGAGATAQVDGAELRVECEARARAPTGAEMEALTGAAVAALALYDMCKSADKGIVISDLRLVRKSGGRSGTLAPQSTPPPPPPPPHHPAGEIYAPLNFAYL